MSLLHDMNYYKNPDAKDQVSVVTDEEGNIFAFVRPGEAWSKWAEINGYHDSETFMKERDWYPERYPEKTQMVWHDGGRLGTIEGGGSLRSVDIIGYYRDGKEHL